MTLIEIDLAGSLDPGFGIRQDQLMDIAPTMEQLRDEFLVQVGRDENHFFDLPMQQYQAYQAEREASPLGRIFDVGTSLHDHVDSIVVVGATEVTATARGIFRSCCDPYHNELSRAERGSRPRMYFAGDTFDNDDLAALLHRLDQRDFRDSPAESRWAMLVMDSGNDSSKQWSEESRLAFQVLLQQLPDPKDFLFSVVTAGSWLDQQTKRLGCENVFKLPGGLSGVEQTLSVLSLLPSAMLGLDCIKLLEGAVMMNDHFRSAAPQENTVLQYVAIHQLLVRDRAIFGRSIKTWPASLDWLTAWYQSIGADDRISASDSQLVVNWFAAKPRYNLVRISDQKGSVDPASGNSNSMSNKMAAAMKAADQLHCNAGRPTVTIRLPTIDTRVLGQIFQMLMIATKIEAQLNDSSALPSSV